MNDLETFDDLQGTDPELLEIRERLPEPLEWSMQNGRRIKAIKNHRSYVPLGILSGEIFSAVETVEFEIQKMGIHDSVFVVWKSLQDGKVYF